MLMAGMTLTSTVTCIGITHIMAMDTTLTGVPAGDGMILGTMAMAGDGAAIMAGTVLDIGAVTGVIHGGVLAMLGVADTPEHTDTASVTALRVLVAITDRADLTMVTTDAPTMEASVTDVHAEHLAMVALPAHGVTQQPEPLSATQVDGVVHSLTTRATIHLTAHALTLRNQQAHVHSEVLHHAVSEAVASEVEAVASEAAVEVAASEVAEVATSAEGVDNHSYPYDVT